MLENGYDLVTNKKHERDKLKDIEDIFKSEIIELESEIIPLLKKMFQLRDELENERSLQR